MSGLIILLAYLATVALVIAGYDAPAFLIVIAMLWFWIAA